MVSVDNQELFETYYQAEYDFNTASLTEEEIDAIKELVKEKRVNYALAPIGEKIFDWIMEQSANIRFELVDFDSEKIDGLLYIPQSGSDKAYVVLNSRKPLINQIFAAAHEYYHYITDYARVKEEPFICNFSALESINEKKASRFAAEFLLPEEALRNEIKLFKKRLGGLGERKWLFEDYAALGIYLTVKYQLPLKAVIYRLYEEHYMDDIEEYIQNYSFIKGILQEIKFLEKRVKHLYGCSNHHFDSDSLIYRQMRLAYDAGLASREEMLADAKLLELDSSLIYEFFDKISDEDEDEDDTELMDYIGQIWRKEL
ncbi:ImmA/IrrE family metallo-endopeptidase [Candidatus Merdisoma sp. JLR.KK011]|uniref:ImmA/IrrE family metallo-endopeptidase n=1 Tax=Candidatus Merdisoma sp. JLR.KK011 TaxID=3114299 RepID=UPI002FEEB849